MKASYKEALEFIAQYAETHDGVPPSAREMVDGLRLSSTSLANLRVMALLKSGHVTRQEGVQRSMRITAKGYAALGKPVPQNARALAVEPPRALQKGTTYQIVHKDGMVFTLTHDCPNTRVTAHMVMALKVGGFSIRPAVLEDAS